MASTDVVPVVGKVYVCVQIPRKNDLYIQAGEKIVVTSVNDEKVRFHLDGNKKFAGVISRVTFSNYFRLCE